jgi:hypothetical protein
VEKKGTIYENSNSKIKRCEKRVWITIRGRKLTLLASVDPTGNSNKLILCFDIFINHITSISSISLGVGIQ